MKYNEDETNNDICWGRNSVFSLLEDYPERCSKVLLAKNIQPHIREKVQGLLRSANVVLQYVDNQVLDRVTNKENHQGIVAYSVPMELMDIEDVVSSLPSVPDAAMIILCDHIQDPHNLGAIIRTAEVAGASAVVIPKRGGCLPTGTVVKTSAGAALRVPLAKIGNIAQAIEYLQKSGFWIIGLAMEADETLFKGDIPKRAVFVIGSEGEGIGKLVAKSCDELRSIPMSGKTGSLNASVAAGLAMFEWSRINKFAI
ncbi:MAG: 23S rRNA (guanosine(2251)-2'-O)-methyltransferase RlmB [Synergistaceae bacterium]|nr:23S rRNA (guanosine(2251)-2'-O)-methyltransferase RlmB [Synergistaceae bacterium]